MSTSRIIRLAVAVAVFAVAGVVLSWPVAFLLLALISGAPLFTVMVAAAVLGALSLPKDFDKEFDGMVANIIGLATGDQAQVMSTIPLFIYAGYLLAEAKTADRLVRFANALLGWMPGGLAIVTIGTCALFTVFTGASGVTIIALGGVLMPALVKNGYPEKFSMGLIAGTGSVGLLFPPALPLFIYGTVFGLTEKAKDLGWDTRRFLFAGIVPGLVLIGMLSAVAVTVAIVKKLPRQKFNITELVRSFFAALPELFVPFGVILGLLVLHLGLSEVAALTVLYVVVLEVAVLRMVTFRMLWTVSREAMAMVGAIFIIIIGSTVLTNFIVTAQVPQKLVEWTKAHVESKIVFLLAINVILLIVGTVMDIFSAIVVVLPLIAPIAYAYSIDPYHLGVIFLLNLEVGYLHPPVGLNLFLTSVKFQRPITEVMWATIPFLITMITALIVITYIPQLTVVPPAERTGPVSTLVSIVENGIEESKVSIATITLVDATGKPLLDAAGKPIVRRFTDCAKQAEADAKADTNSADGKKKNQQEIENERNICQKLFFDVTDCRPTPKVEDPKQIACANRAIAEWTIANMNGDALDQEKAIVLVTEVVMADETGKPVEHDEPAIKDGKPVLDALGEPVLEKQPIVGKDGKPIVRKLASCPPIGPDNKVSTARETCRALFIEASNCKIVPHDPAECIAAKTKDCAADKLAECTAEQTAACTKLALDKCIFEKVVGWVDEHPDDAKHE